MTTVFERKFKHMLAAMHNGDFNETVIDLREANLTSKHVDLLADALAANFQVTKHIAEIDLAFNGLHELPADIFKDCDGLRILNLDNNALTKLPKLPDRPYALQDFFAGNNPLKKIAPKYFANCISLKAVYLNATHLQTAPNLDDSLSLTWLHLNANPIKKFPADYFAHFAHLDTVFINDTHLKELPDMHACKKLHEVWVDDIKIPARHIVETAQVMICKTEQ